MAYFTIRPVTYEPQLGILTAVIEIQMTQFTLDELRCSLQHQEPCALLCELNPLKTTLINQAGHLCRVTLRHYQEADLLSSFVVPVNISVVHSPLVAIPVDSIISKLMLISVSDSHYCVVQPNIMERH